MIDKFKKFWKRLGPGLITGASDDDPSGIISYSIAGVKYGFTSLWTMLFILPLMIVIQEMSARIGLSSSCGLAGNIKRHYSKLLLVFISTLIIVSNVFNIGADIYGMAAAVELLLPGSTKVWSLIIILLMIFLVVKLPYRKIVAIFKWLAVSLLAYVLAGVLFIHDWPEVIRNTFIPTFQWDYGYLIIIMAIFGTTISPYLAFWQASEEAEEERIKRGNTDGKFMCEFKTITRYELRRAMEDTKIGMVFSNLVGFFIIALTASVLFSAGIKNIETIQEAAEALRPLAGDYAYLLFTLGIISSGLLAIPILAGSSAYVMAEIFNWKASLDRPFSKAKEFYIVIIIATALGMLMPFFGIGPVKALFWTAIIHAIVAPFLIITLIHMANNPLIVGPNVNKKYTNYIAYITLIIMLLIAITFVIAELPFPTEMKALIYSVFPK